MEISQELRASSKHRETTPQRCPTIT